MMELLLLVAFLLGFVGGWCLGCVIIKVCRAAMKWALR